MKELQVIEYYFMNHAVITLKEIFDGTKGGYRIMMSRGYNWRIFTSVKFASWFSVHEEIKRIVATSPHQFRLHDKSIAILETWRQPISSLQELIHQE